MPKKLNRLISIFIAILLLGMLTGFFFFWYQNRTSYQTLISKDAQLLVRVDVFSILRSSWRDLRYINSDTEKQSSGISLPANVFAWTSASAGSAVFISLPLKDSAKFSSWLQAKDFQRTDQKFWRHKGGQISLLNNRQKAIICIDINKGDHLVQMTGMLDGKNMVAVSESMFADINKQEGHITWCSREMKGALNFEDGKVIALIKTPHRKKDKQGFTPSARLAKGEALKISFSGDINAFLDKRIYRFDSLSVSGDSLKTFGITGFQLCLLQPVLQKDSIVTYEYDDNFEKVAVAYVSQKEVPGVSMTIFATGALHAYLKRENIIKDNGYLSRAVFPLSPVKVVYGEGMLNFYSGSRVPSYTQGEGTDFFEAEVDFNALAKQPDFAMFSYWWKPFTKLTANGTIKDGVDVYQAQLYCRQPQSNSLIQLLKAWDAEVRPIPML